MATDRILPRLVARPIGLLATALAMVVAFSAGVGVAHADNTLSSASPGVDSTVDASPTSIAMNFSQALGGQNTVSLVCGGTNAGIGSPAVSTDGLTLSVAVPEPLSAGTCTVAWSVSAPDGSPNGQGTFSFTIAGAAATTAAPATTAVTSTTVAGGGAPATTAPSTGDGSSSSGGSKVGGPLGVSRLIGTLGLAVIFGSLLLIGVAWPEGVEYILTVRFLRTAWVVAVLGVYLWTASLAAQVSGKSLGSSLLPTSWNDLTDSTAGLAAIVRMVFTVACGWVVIRPERVIDPNTQLICLGLPGVAVATMGFDRGGDLAVLGYAAGVLHAIAMAAWIGGLVLLARVVLAGPGDEDLVHAVRGFGRLSNPALLITVVTGAIQTFRLDRGSIFSTGHGRVLLLKAIVVGGMVFVGIAARQFIRARLSRANTMSAAMASRLRRAISIEALFGIVVLALTAWMMSFTPATIAAAETSNQPKLPGEAFIKDQGLAVTVSISQVIGPNAVRVEVDEPRTGLAGLTVKFTPPEGTAASPVTLDVSALTGQGIAFLPIEQGVPLTAAGTWTITVEAGGVAIGSKNIQISA